jgi:hypothetical protein
MDTQEHIQVLRLHLLAMSKLSQRAVDYAIKGYELGSPEFCRHTRRGDVQLYELRHRITDLARRLLMHELSSNPKALMDELTADAKVRFTMCALRISTALHAACNAAAEIAQNTMLLLEQARVSERAALQRVCCLVNRMMGLCIVALFKKDVQHAEIVLHNRQARRLFEQTFHDLRYEIERHNDIDQRTAAPALLELAIARGLNQIARETSEIAEAILFWLEGKEWILEPALSCEI